MRRKIALLLALLLCGGVFVLKAEPEVTLGTMLYSYNFFWVNSDFNKSTSDRDNFSYIHGDININVSFNKDVSIFVRLGAWGQFGQHPIYGVPADPAVKVLEGYLDVKNLLGPLGLRFGKWRFLYGDGLVAFDGGEDGTLGVQLYGDLSDKVSLDLFYRRLAEGGGIAQVYWAGVEREEVEDDLDVFGIYPTFKLGKKATLNLYAMLRRHKLTQEPYEGVEQPIWTGIRVEASPAKGLDIRAEYVKMMGKMDLKVSGVDQSYDFAGFALLAVASYKFTDKLNAGAAYMLFSGDDPDSSAYETYFSVTEGPFTYGFYKWWPGLGPAHLMTTGYGFSCIAPWNPTMTNLQVIDVFAGYATGDYSIRVDFWNYSRHRLEPDQSHKAMGNEISLFATYNLKNTVTVGAAVGYWMPGSHYKEDFGLGSNASGMLGGYLFFFKSFDIKLK